MAARLSAPGWLSPSPSLLTPARRSAAWRRPAPRPGWFAWPGGDAVGRRGDCPGRAGLPQLWPGLYPRDWLADRDQRWIPSFSALTDRRRSVAGAEIPLAFLAVGSGRTVVWLPGDQDSPVPVSFPLELPVNACPYRPAPSPPVAAVMATGGAICPGSLAGSTGAMVLAGDRQPGAWSGRGGSR